MNKLEQTINFLSDMEKDWQKIIDSHRPQFDRTRHSTNLRTKVAEGHIKPIQSVLSMLIDKRLENQRETENES
tara:strand:- start:1485 stop:1703 length:219 start_codon:yes stop_codon:yes gene_type:complete